MSYNLVTEQDFFKNKSSVELMTIVSIITSQPLARAENKWTALRRLEKALFSNYTQSDAEQIVGNLLLGKKVEEAIDGITKTNVSTLAEKVKEVMKASPHTRPKRDDPFKGRIQRIKPDTSAEPAKTKKLKKAEKAEKAEKPTNGRRTRDPGGSFAEMKLYPRKESNPRRMGSHGFKSLAIIHRHPGITTEGYLKAGGRLVDLRWDVKNGNVKTEKA